MNIGILTVKDFDFHPNRRLKQAADIKGHNITLINPYEMTAEIKKREFGYSIDKITADLDVIIPRQGSPMGDYGLVLIRHFNTLGIPVVNNLEGITIARNQFVTLQALTSHDIPVPDTLFITKKNRFLKAVNRIGSFPVIVKQVNGIGGDGVLKVNSQKEAAFFLKENLKKRRGVLVQKFIPPENRLDIRVFTIGEKVAGAMQLQPSNHNYRSNIHQQSRARELNLSKELKAMAIRASRACHLEIAGVDIILENRINPLVIEVNYSPGFKGLEAATGLDIAEQIINYTVSVCKKKELGESVHENQ